MPLRENCGNHKLVLHRKLPGADPELVEHGLPLTAAFDTAVAYTMRFGIVKLQLAQC